jgi:hypothetical protein
LTSSAESGSASRGHGVQRTSGKLLISEPTAIVVVAWK